MARPDQTGHDHHDSEPHPHGHTHPDGGHTHVFLGENHRRNERKVWLVIALTAATMAAEIIAGTVYGSMALLADGWHMSTHAGAMLVAAGAYWYARREAHNARFTFGTGKLGDLAGFASAIALALIALLIAVESLLRLFSPGEIAFDQAILVAGLGLVVNLVSAWLLQDTPHHHHEGHHGHRHGAGHHHHHDDEAHDHHHGAEEHHGHHAHGHHHHGHHAGADNNLRAAYLHVLADALTSVLAIVALLLGRSYGLVWLDPVMGIVGGLVIARWSFGLIRDTSRVLLDAVPGEGQLARSIRMRLEGEGERITDLHVWQVGPGHHAAIVSLVTQTPQAPQVYKEKIADLKGLSHVTMEVTPA
ncbi:CDF family Co(II)/Ni(II) efflux transporter DmeF [Rhizobium sp. SL86]|uniref:CDF family Co(II)/Ni(II) efflux transporter DmeF n=1 Tax=Rhizobium sp. SL86 TaxID=2995148 RepID=UPI002272E287|nr:CDF family Co(II)/Ni(II) efflux transporter DmeF [Rhizobium sp. SL86]MCY1664241.1 CDF family Co(II)/Ni(II) efflux transporter DmeF [Rhizobium sp. SL86]